MTREKVHGVLVVDKPKGPTSHDVVARIRRTIHERRVGHAGTLDPLATGVIVALIGEATKLAPFLTADDKRYVARVALGSATTTLDAEGEVVASGAVPDSVLAELRTLESDPSAPETPLIASALRAESARDLQVPPAFSAIHIDGKRSHDLARSGEDVVLEPRSVQARALRAIRAYVAAPMGPAIELDVHVSKGYYVRSLARDLGDRLGCPAHLAALRRTASGAFAIDQAVSLDADEASLRGAIIPIADAARRAMSVARLTEAGALRARQGKQLLVADFCDGHAPPSSGVAAWLNLSDKLVAVGQAAEEGTYVVVRGFHDA